MSRMQYDPEDLIGMIIFVAGTLGTLGFTKFTLFGIGLNDVLLEFSADGYTTQLTIAIFMSLLGLGLIIASNDLEWRAWTGFQLWLVITVVWLVLSPPFVPIMQSLLLGSDVGGIIAFVVQTLGAGFLSWSG